MTIKVIQSLAVTFIMSLLFFGGIKIINAQTTPVVNPFGTAGQDSPCIINVTASTPLNQICQMGFVCENNVCKGSNNTFCLSDQMCNQQQGLFCIQRIDNRVYACDNAAATAGRCFCGINDGSGLVTEQDSEPEPEPEPSGGAPRQIVGPDARNILKGLKTAATQSEINTITLENLTIRIVRYLLSFLSLVALVLVVYGGFKMMTAGGNKDAVIDARGIVIYAFAGLLVISFSTSLVSFVGRGIDVILSGPSAAESTSVVGSAASGVVSGTVLGKTVDPRQFVLRAISYILSFAGIIALGFIVYAGGRWMTSAGNASAVKEAQVVLRNALIGLFLVGASFAIVSFFQTVVNIANPTNKTNQGKENKVPSGTIGASCTTQDECEPPLSCLQTINGIQYACSSGAFCVCGNYVAPVIKKNIGESCLVGSDCVSNNCSKIVLGNQVACTGAPEVDCLCR